ncbi:MAG: hypothetical protein AABY22_30405 [Nanoarchaeota archaeon]
MLSNLFNQNKKTKNFDIISSPREELLTSFESEKISEKSSQEAELLVPTVLKGFGKVSKLTGELAYAIPKYATRAALQLGISIPGVSKKIGRIEPEEEFGPLGPKVIGEEPILPLQEQYKEYTQIAQSLGFGKTAPIIAIVGTLGGPALDLWFGGGTRKQAFEELVTRLVKETNPEIITKDLVQNLKIPENIAKEFAPKLAEVTDKSIIKKGLDEIASRIEPQATKGISKRANELVEASINTDPLLRDVPKENIFETARRISKLNESGTIREADILEAFTIHSGQAAKTLDNIAEETIGAFGERIKQIVSVGSEKPPVLEDIAKNILENLQAEEPPNLRKIQEEVVTSSNSITEEQRLSIDRVIKALDDVKPIRAETEKLFTEERGKRLARAIAVGEKTTGEAGFLAELSQLKGELPKIEKDLEAIRNMLNQKDIDNIFDAIKQSPLLNEWDKIAARDGLLRLFSPLGTVVPTEGQLRLLERALGSKVVDAILSKKSLWDKLKNIVGNILNVPRSLMSSFDLSAPFRQGILLISHPKRFFSAFLDMFKVFGSEKAFRALQESIIRMPTNDLAQQGKLAFGEIGSVLTAREERFMSNWAEKIPLIGKGVRASGRAYTGFLNKLRADVFQDLILKAEALGLNPRNNSVLVEEIAKFVNVASGRGSFKDLERAVPFFNSVFFSPRLMASRLTLLNPLYYIRSSPFVRREALKSLFTFLGAGLTVLTFAKMNGAEIGDEPRSADYGKIKIDNTRIDIWAGFQQYIRMATQLWTGEYVSSTTGKLYELGEGYKPLTRWDILLRQIESKESPILSFATDILRQQDYAGRPVKVTTEIAERLIPMVIGDVYDLAQEDPNLIPLIGFGILGGSIQTYNKLSKGFGGQIKKNGAGFKLKSSNGSLRGFKK